jgi:hypothetical protein
MRERPSPSSRGVSAGSAYDLYARLMAQFMGKHIARNPSFVVENMTGLPCALQSSPRISQIDSRFNGMLSR